MSEQHPEPPAAGRRAQGKKVLGMSRAQAIGLGIVAAAGLVYLLYRARKKAQAAASAQQGTSTAGSCPDGSAPDASGNCPQNSQDLSGQLGTLQSEIAALQGAMSGSSGSGGTAGTVAGSTGTPTTDTTQTGTSAGTTTASPGTTASAGSGTGTTAIRWAFPAPSGLTAYSKSATGYRLRWNAVRGPLGQAPTGYTVATYNSAGQLVDEFVTGGTDTAEYGRGGKGLPKGAYHTNVWANGAPQAPQHATTNVVLTS